MKEIQGLGKLLSQKMNKSAFSRGVQTSLILEFANEELGRLFGLQAAKQMKAASLRGSVISISVGNSIFAQELKFKQNQLITAVNQKFSKDTVKRLKIVQKGVEKDENY